MFFLGGGGRARNLRAHVGADTVRAGSGAPAGATHPRHRGGWRGGIACRNPVVKSTHEEKKNALRGEVSGAASLTKDYLAALAHRKRGRNKQTETRTGKKTRRTSCDFEREIRLEMNTNDAKEYLARREIPQLFEVRDVWLCGVVG